MIEIRHLRSMAAIAEMGSLSAAAASLSVTQSALSHQIKTLEHFFDLPLFLRRHKPLKLTAAGLQIVALAEQVLPLIARQEKQLSRISGGEAGRLHIAIECHSCFDWLLPILDEYRLHWPEVEVDLRIGVSFAAVEALSKGDIDVVVSSDPTMASDIEFHPLFDFEAMLAVDPEHALAEKKYIEAGDLKLETVLTYPVPRSRLDVFNRFLQPAGIEPKAIRQVELTAMMLQLVASRRGVAVLPDWVLREVTANQRIAARPLGKTGLHGTLYAALRRDESKAAYLEDFIARAKAAHQSDY